MFVTNSSQLSWVLCPVCEEKSQVLLPLGERAALSIPQDLPFGATDLEIRMGRADGHREKTEHSRLTAAQSSHDGPQSLFALKVSCQVSIIKLGDYPVCDFQPGRRSWSILIFPISQNSSRMAFKSEIE